MKNIQRVTKTETDIENFFKKYSNALKIDDEGNVTMDFREFNQVEIKEIMMFCYTFKEFKYFDDCLLKYCKKQSKEIKIKDSFFSFFKKWVNIFH